VSSHVHVTFKEKEKEEEEDDDDNMIVWLSRVPFLRKCK